MGMQRSLFTGVSIPFLFPYAIFTGVLITSIICAIISTWVPAKKIMNY